ncbi:MAG: mechanosensitive ion channel family protein [Gammaproteobacteria bacterium]|nr:mechanosensitive ion channel family protein [Gammaproteobacteria bacterium]NNM19929.1 mechanosensitive ion channel family protein [Gammaproteobacteria bacterium]
MEQITALLADERVAQWLRAGLIIIIGLVLARLASRVIYRSTRVPMGEHRAVMLKRLVFYALFVLVAMAALRELGFSLGVVLGAAGVLSVALGFASQTSASNLISGLFLVAEAPFSIGDIIKLGDRTGEVLSIDLLSVKLRTFDNLYVRIPNETLIKSEIVNLTRFPIRRLDLMLGVAYKEDIAQVRELLIAVADDYPLCLDEPRPLLIFQGFGNSSLDLQFSIWSRRENFLEIRNMLPERIKQAFDEHGIEIPFPHVSVYTGSVTEPFPVQLMPGDASKQPDEKN